MRYSLPQFIPPLRARAVACRLTAQYHVDESLPLMLQESLVAQTKQTLLQQLSTVIQVPALAVESVVKMAIPSKPSSRKRNFGKSVSWSSGHTGAGYLKMCLPVLPSIW